MKIAEKSIVKNPNDTVNTMLTLQMIDSYIFLNDSESANRWLEKLPKSNPEHSHASFLIADSIRNQAKLPMQYDTVDTEGTESRAQKKANNKERRDTLWDAYTTLLKTTLTPEIIDLKRHIGILYSYGKKASFDLDRFHVLCNDNNTRPMGSITMAEDGNTEDLRSFFDDKRALRKATKHIAKLNIK